MKRVEVRKNRVVETPWLRIEDAAAYCGLSRSAFDERAKHVPHAGDERLRLYHTQVLDRWIQGEIAEAPFVLQASRDTQPRRRARARKATGTPILFVDPVNGKPYMNKGGKNDA